MNKRLSDSQFRKRINPYLFSLPIILVFFFAVGIPLIQDFYFSMTDWKSTQLEKNFIGFANYAKLFKDSTFLLAGKNTLILTIFVAFLQNAFSLLLASILTSKYFKGKTSAEA